MFKEGSSLQDLQRLLPNGMLVHATSPNDFTSLKFANEINGAVLIDGRFALLMHRHWGDLRKFIDARMIHNSMHGSPFRKTASAWCMLQITMGMKELHKRNITHRDLKAANVLLLDLGSLLKTAASLTDSTNRASNGHFRCLIADYDCSVGVVGTGFWRAPEILLGVKNGNVAPELFTEASDVYSYGMTCYKILTGCIPFEVEGFKANDYDRVTDRSRPSLPSKTPQWMKALLSKCWHKDPLERPTFERNRA